MTRKQKQKYADTDELRKVLFQALSGKRYLMDCGHFVSFWHHLGNDITIYNGKKPKIICSQCGH